MPIYKANFDNNGLLIGAQEIYSTDDGWNIAGELVSDVIGEEILADVIAAQNKYYLSCTPGYIEFRPDMALSVSKYTLTADGVDTVNITGIPANSVVKIGETVYNIGDGEIEITVDFPGTYHVEISCWPYVTEKFDLVAL